MDIKSKEDFKQLYEKDPGFALGIMFENVEGLKRRCDCRLEDCRNKMKVLRAKNIAIQSGSGIVGGFLAWMATKLGGG